MKPAPASSSEGNTAFKSMLELGINERYMVEEGIERVYTSMNIWNVFSYLF